jgi:starvation-inducible outer membrane lipoprotein
MKLLPILMCIGLVACATEPKKTVRNETSECMQYRSMKTAPLPPIEMQKLKEACEASLSKSS